MLGLSACSEDSPAVSNAPAASSSAASSSAAPTSEAPSTTSTPAAPSTTAAPTTSAAPSTTAAPSTSVPVPAGGMTVKGTGYTFVVKKGFIDAKGKVPGASSVDTMVLNALDKDGFADNINVVQQSGASGASLSLLESAAKTQLEAAGATGYKVLPRTTVAGTEASHITANVKRADAQGKTQRYLVDQLYVLRGDKSYVVTFSFNANATQATRDALINPTVASWKWTA